MRFGIDEKNTPTFFWLYEVLIEEELRSALRKSYWRVMTAKPDLPRLVERAYLDCHSCLPPKSPRRPHINCNEPVTLMNQLKAEQTRLSLAIQATYREKKHTSQSPTRVYPTSLEAPTRDVYVWTTRDKWKFTKSTHPGIQEGKKGYENTLEGGTNSFIGFYSKTSLHDFRPQIDHRSCIPTKP